MSGCSQNFSLFDFITPNENYSDEMLPLITKQKQTSQVNPVTPNLDIILSKILDNQKLNDIQIQQLSEQERLVLEHVEKRSASCKKRPDQYQKLFFKKAFKYAEKVYFGKKNKNKSRKMSSFYHHHFQNITKAMNIPLVNFYHPDRKTKPGLRIGQKSFNLSYIKLLLRSDTFRQVSKDYQLRFKHQCIAERKNKLSKFIRYIRDLIAKFGHNREKIGELIKSSKCKIPWTNLQIQEADRRAVSELETKGQQKGNNSQIVQQSEQDAVQSQEPMSSE